MTIIVITVILSLAQTLFTLNSQTQIRYEELAESVRNPFWLSQGLVYDGVSTNVGWYGILLGFYNIFGFGLGTAKFLRLGLAFVSILCLALLLKKYLGKNYLLPLIVIGLSPTLLYFNTLQTSYGIDLEFLPIVLYLSHLRYLRYLSWALAMVAWMSYPAFIFYLPALIILWFKYNNYNNYKDYIIKFGGSLIAFLAPLGLALLFVKNRDLLFFDPETGSGIFRGAGGTSLTLNSISTNLGGVFRDLFQSGQSYNFELFWGEFSLIFPIVSLMVIVGIVFLIREQRLKRLAGLVLVVLAFTLLFPSLTSDPSGEPGIRRYTPFLAAFYALFTIVWWWLNSSARGPAAGFPPEKPNMRGPLSGPPPSRAQERPPRPLAIAILSLLLVHHAVVYPINLAHLGDLSPNRYPLWFTTRDTPKESLESLVLTVKKEDLKLVCRDGGTPIYCRYAETYAAVAGYCLWNKIPCKNILGYDLNSGKFVTLSVFLWESYQLEH